MGTADVVGLTVTVLFVPDAGDVVGLNVTVLFAAGVVDIVGLTVTVVFARLVVACGVTVSVAVTSGVLSA